MQSNRFRRKRKTTLYLGIFAAIIAVCLPLGSWALTTHSFNPTRDCQTATLLLDDQPYSNEAQSKAKRLFQRVLNTDARNIPAMVGLARITAAAGYVNGDNYEPACLQEALALLNRALAINPKSSDALTEKGFDLAYQRKFDQAMVIASEAEALGPGDAKVGLLKAKIADMRGDEATAAKIAEGVLRSTSYKAYKRRAYSYVAYFNESTKRYPEAENAWVASMALYPEDPWIKNNYCGFLMRTAQYDRAIEIGEKALARMDFGMIHSNLASAYFRRGYDIFWKERRFIDATPYFEKSLIHQEHPDTYWMLGLCLREKARQGQTEEWLKESTRAFEHALALDPNHTQARTELQKQLDHERAHDQ